MEKFKVHTHRPNKAGNRSHRQTNNPQPQHNNQLRIKRKKKFNSSKNVKSQQEKQKETLIQPISSHQMPKLIKNVKGQQEKQKETLI